MPALADNDPKKWAYELHTAVKHRILTKYLSPWITILGSRGESLAYVDGFAGRGRYETGEAGSPLLVLSEMSIRARGNPRQRFSCHLVEANRDNFANLKKEVEAHPASSNPQITINLYCSSFSTAANKIISDIRRNGQPSFFFVDPFGYDDPTMSTLGTIMTLPRAEVFINLMFNFAHRAISISDNPALAQVLDNLFGTSEWRVIAPLAGAERERAFAELYRKQLRGQGATHVVRFRMGDDQINRTLYYLVHGTKHPKGGTLMKEVMVALASPGELGYGGATRHVSVPLFDMNRLDLPSLLHDRYAGKTVTFDGLIIDTLEDDQTATCREKDYRAAVYSLEKQGVVTIKRVTTIRGLDGNDEITFKLYRQSSLF
jgi:three-Cys-motif partner protein